VAVRGLFGVAPYSAYYRPAESSIRAPQVTPTPPKIPFVTTPDPRPAVYQARPSRDASMVIAPNLRPDVTTLGIRRYFTTDIPVPAYRTAIMLLRGGVGDPPAAAPSPPVMPFVTSAQPPRETLRSADRIFAPIFGQYEPFGSGMFLTTPVPWRGGYPGADASLVVPIVLPPITLATNLRRFVTLLSYQKPHRQDASMFLITQGTLSGVPVPPVPVPVELRRFLMTDWAWRVGPSYAYDASRVTGPAHQPGDNFHPMVGFGSPYIPILRRRRR
jgi:hypothetical protein